MNVWQFLGLWLLVSIILGPLIGPCIRFGMNGPKEMEKPDADLQ